jgi:transcriptional regulator with XRE-family HTH domain
MAPRQLDIPVVSAALGAVLAEQRQSVELKQTAAAERAYVSHDRLRALERGSRQATICEFLSLGEALGVDPRELFTRVLAKVHYPVGYRPVKTV